MKQSMKMALAGMTLTLTLSVPVLAQQPTQTTAEGSTERSSTGRAPAKATKTSPRQGYTKPAAVGTNNGNAGNSVLPTSTQGSTSDGSASRASNGGGQGTKTRETRKPQPKAVVTSASSGKQQPSASGSGQPQAARPGTAGDSRVARSAQGAKENSATSAGLTGARPNDALNKAQTKVNLSPIATKGSSRNTQNRQAATISTSGKTGSRRPATTAQVQKEARTPDEMSATGYPEPTGVGKPGTPAGNAKGKKGNTNAQSYPQPTKQ